MTLLAKLPLTVSALALAGLLWAAPIAAQDAGDAPAAPELNLDMGEPVGEESGQRVGEPYILEVSGDWEIRCVRTGLEADPCALHQLLEDGSGNAVATFELVNLPAGQQA